MLQRIHQWQTKIFPFPVAFGNSSKVYYFKKALLSMECVYYCFVGWLCLLPVVEPDPKPESRLKADEIQSTSPLCLHIPLCKWTLQPPSTFVFEPQNHTWYWSQSKRMWGKNVALNKIFLLLSSYSPGFFFLPISIYEQQVAVMPQPQLLQFAPWLFSHP